MITILRGPRATLARFGVPSDLTMRWDVTHEAPAWAGMRAMTAQLRAALGDPAVHAAFDGHAAHDTAHDAAHDTGAPLVMVSLALKTLDAHLSVAQKRAREQASGSTVARYPWAQPRSSPVARAWAETVATLVEGRCALVIVPEIERVDLSTLRAARPLLRRAKASLSFLFGHDTLVAPAAPFEAWLRKLKLRELSLIEALPGVRVERVDLRNEPMMARRGSSYEEREPRSLETMRAAFDAFAFDTALRLALELSPKLEGAELREAHALAALSAMSLDPHVWAYPGSGRPGSHAASGPKGDDFAVGMMEAGFLGALEGETDPKKRAHWAYQLSVVFARARGEVATALKYGDQAVREAETARAGYLEAWARLGRAQARILAERPEDAASDLEAALVRLDDPAALRETPKVLLETARAVVANERARVAAALGRRDDLRHYRRIAEAHAVALSSDERPGYDWLAPVDDDLMPTATRAYHSAELARARERFEPEDERAAARALASAEMCLGDALAAKEHIRTATRIGVLTKRPPNEVFAMQLESIVAAVRAGASDDAERDLSLVRADPRCEGDAAQAEALAMLALVAAGRKDAPTAVERAKAALSQAERSGEAGTITRVRKAAADTYLKVGRAADAKALAEAAHAALTAETAPEDALGVIVTLLCCGTEDDALVVEAVARAAEALPEVTAWWELPRLLPHVRRVIVKGASAVDPAALSATLAAAAQRPDCAELVGQIRGL